MFFSPRIIMTSGGKCWMDQVSPGVHTSKYHNGRAKELAPSRTLPYASKQQPELPTYLYQLGGH